MKQFHKQSHYPMVSKDHTPHTYMLSLYTADTHQSSLYLFTTNIPYDEGKEFAMDALINSDPKPREPLPEIWVNSSIWCLKITSLSLSICKYKTLHAMGMKMAPAYANIFMSKIEHQYHSDQLMETKSFCGNFRR